MEKEENMLNDQELESVSGGSGVPRLIYIGTIQSVNKDTNSYYVYVPQKDGCIRASSISQKDIPVGTRVTIRYNDKYKQWLIVHF